MAKLEEQHYTWPCPCGQGTIEWTFYSPTAPFQTGYDGPRSLNCEACSKEWAIAEGKPLQLQKRAAVAAYHEALKQEGQARVALRRVVIDPVVNALHGRAKARG